MPIKIFEKRKDFDDRSTEGGGDSHEGSWVLHGEELNKRADYLKCEEVEAALRTTEQSLAKLHRLLDNKPIEYVAMVLSGKMQAYCDIEDEMVKGMFGTIVQGYLKKGYNRATAEMMAREFFRYES